MDGGWQLVSITLFVQAVDPCGALGNKDVSRKQGSALSISCVKYLKCEEATLLNRKVMTHTFFLQLMKSLQST